MPHSPTHEPAKVERIHVGPTPAKVHILIQAAAGGTRCVVLHPLPLGSLGRGIYLLFLMKGMQGYSRSRMLLITVHVGHACKLETHGCY